MGLEPTTPGSTDRCSNRLSYAHRAATAKGIVGLAFPVVKPEGLTEGLSSTYTLPQGAEQPFV